MSDRYPPLSPAQRDAIITALGGIATAPADDVRKAA